MITVIVPTMWKAEEINHMVPKLDVHPLVGEIIVIDNEPKHKREATCSFSKVTYITYGENIFPVESWNVGAEKAKFDKLLIINDDVMFSEALVDGIYDHITEENGMITMDPNSVGTPLPNYGMSWTVAKENISIKPCEKLAHRCAIVIGIHRKSYNRIPNDFKIYFNDNFLFDMCKKQGKPNLMLCGAELRTEMSKTVKLFPEITRHEFSIYKKVYDRYGLPHK